MPPIEPEPTLPQDNMADGSQDRDNATPADDSSASADATGDGVLDQSGGGALLLMLHNVSLLVRLSMTNSLGFVVLLIWSMS